MSSVTKKITYDDLKDLSITQLRDVLHLERERHNDADKERRILISSILQTQALTEAVFNAGSEGSV